MKHKRMEWKAKFLAIAIAIVFTAFIFYGVNTVHPSPEWDDYCGDVYVAPNQINTSEQCVSAGGQWNTDRYPKPVVPREGTMEPGWCDFYQECQDAYDGAHDKYRQVVFFVTLIAGLAALIGSLAIGAGSVSAGIMGGGILTMFLGIMFYWERLGDYVRVIMLGIVLVILVWVGYKKLK